VRALGLGDFLTGVPALRALAEAWPAHRIVLGGPGSVRSLAAAAGVIDEFVVARPLTPVALGRSPDIAVNLHGRGPESHRVALASRPRRLIAFRHPDVPESDRMPEWRRDEHEVARWCRLLEESGIPADASRLDLPVPPGSVPHGVAGATVVHPGAASPARRWPADRWAAVARHETGRGRTVVVTGSAGEVGVARKIASFAGLPAEAVLAGTTDVAGLARVVAAAGRIVCGDTGVAHLATAFCTPSVVLFGPTSPDRWGPPPDRREHTVLWAGRTGDPHASTPDPGLLEITVDDVLCALERPSGRT
jgi:ADP-heptose:LPS heptosyltransferase